MLALWSDFSGLMGEGDIQSYGPDRLNLCRMDTICELTQTPHCITQYLTIKSLSCNELCIVIKHKNPVNQLISVSFRQTLFRTVSEH